MVIFHSYVKLPEGMANYKSTLVMVYHWGRHIFRYFRDTWSFHFAECGMKIVKLTELLPLNHIFISFHELCRLSSDKELHTSKGTPCPHVSMGMCRSRSRTERRVNLLLRRSWSQRVPLKDRSWQPVETCFDTINFTHGNSVSLTV